MTGNSAGLRTVLSSRLSHRELRSSFRESHSFLSLPADATMASSQGTQPSKVNKREATSSKLLPVAKQLTVTISLRFGEFAFLKRVFFNPLNAELNPICQLLALLRAHYILHV